MAKKINAQFFNIRRFKSGGFGCMLHGKQCGSIYNDGSKFWACTIVPYKTEYEFDSFAAAEMWVWQNWRESIA